MNPVDTYWMEPGQLKHVSTTSFVSRPSSMRPHMLFDSCDSSPVDEPEECYFKEGREEECQVIMDEEESMLNSPE